MFDTGAAADSEAVTSQVIEDAFARIGAQLDRLDGEFATVGAAMAAMDAVEGLSGRLAVLAARALRVCERAGMPADCGAADAASWLAGRSGVSRREAARRVKVAGTLGQCPDTAAALEAGAITPDHVAAIGDAIADGTLGDARETERQLLDSAKRKTPEGLRREFNRRRRDADPEGQAERERTAFQRRWLRLDRDDDAGGMWRLSGMLDPESGAYIATCLENMLSPDGVDVAPELRRSAGQLRADALRAMAQFVMDHGGGPGQTKQATPHVSVIVGYETFARAATRPSAHHGTDPHAARPAGYSRNPGAGNGSRSAADPDAGEGDSRSDVDPDAGNGDRDGEPTSRDGDGAHDATNGRGGACNHERIFADTMPPETIGGMPLSDDALARTLCDSTIQRIVIDADGQPVNLGRATRRWSGAQRAAIVARDRHCRFPHCDRPASWCVIHHVRWWMRDHGRTDIRNGVLLCTYHHQQVVHDDTAGWTLNVDPATAEVIVTDPRGNIHTSHPPGFRQPGPPAGAHGRSGGARHRTRAHQHADARPVQPEQPEQPARSGRGVQGDVTLATSGHGGGP